VTLATGVTNETAIAVAPDGEVFAFVDGQDLYVCPTTGCTASQASTPYASGIGAVSQFGLVFDGSSPESLYWVGTSSLQRCSSVAPGGTCKPAVLVSGLFPTSGIGVDGGYVYYLQGPVLARVPR
jgi:hypothetical protein